MSEVVVIDVSKWQGVIDFEKVAPNINGAIVKASEMTFTDSKFADNWNGFRAAGVPVGAYHFFRPSADGRANKSQAEWFFGTIEKTGHLGQLDLWLDCERNDSNLSLLQMRDAIWKFIYRLEELSGKTCNIYTSSGFWNYHVARSEAGNTDIPRGRKLWIANYNVKQPTLPHDWNKRGLSWQLWQYTSKGRLPGISAYIDLNHFNGTLEQFNKMFGLKASPVIPAPVEPPQLTEPPKVVKIAGLQGDETLRLRASIFGEVVGKTWNDCVFPVQAYGQDAQARTWYQIGKGIWVASWYCERVG